jgi:Flp pilus assembly protein TadD
VTVTAIGVVLLLLAADSLLAERRIDASQAAAGEGDLEQAADEARGASLLRPWDSEARLQLALIQESAGQLNAAEQSISEAIERSPNDWILWVIRGRIAASDARAEDAFRAYTRGIGLNPRGAAATGLIEALAPPAPPQQPPGSSPTEAGRRPPGPAASGSGAP